MHNDHSTDDGVSRTLQSITNGAEYIVSLARQRVAGVLDALDEGDFGKARYLAHTVAGTLSPLADAQGGIAIADGAKLIEMGDLQVGMTVHNIGTVTEVEMTHCDRIGCAGHVRMKVGEHEMTFDADSRAYVADE